MSYDGYILVNCGTLVLESEQLAELLERLAAMHRRAQKAEGELQRMQSRGGSWDSLERRREAAERDRMMKAIRKADAHDDVHLD